MGVLLGNGDGTFQTAQTYVSGGRYAEAIALQDVNADSKLDALVVHPCALSYCSGFASVLGVMLGATTWQTTTTLTSNLNPSIYGQAVTLTATVNTVGWIVPTGYVTFRNGGSGMGTVALSSNAVATLTKTNLPAGTLSLTATYNGDLQSAKSTSASLTQVVNPASTTTSITSSVNPSSAGQPVTFTAKVTSPTTKVTGTVTFVAGETDLGTIPLSGGKASVTTSTLPVGTTKVTASYNGTANISGSGASLMQVVS